MLCRRNTFTMNSLQSVFLFTLLPVVALIIGGMVAIFKVPSPRTSSYIQHFAAGVVFAAVAGEILPGVMREHAPIPAIIGFGLGVALMLGVRSLAERIGTRSGGEAKQPITLIAIVGIDILIDGLLLGVGFAAGAEQGVLLGFAITLEVLFLGLSASAGLNKAGAPRGQAIGLIVALALLLALGAVIGVTLLRGLTGQMLEAALAFGAAALLFLVTEELLVEAHEVPETPLTTAIFFVGFLILFVIEMVVSAPTTGGR